MLKGALHIHTTCSDGALLPEEALRVYRGLGFDFAALTDHDFLMKPGAYDGLPEEFEGMLIFKGVEKTIFARGYVHVNLIFGERETLHIYNHPAEYAISVAQAVDQLQELERTIPIHAVDVTAKGFYTPEFDIEAIPHPKVASDDSHTREGCGRAWIEVDCAKEKDVIIRAIKEGRARMRCNGTARQAAWPKQGGNQSG